MKDSEMPGITMFIHHVGEAMKYILSLDQIKNTISPEHTDMTPERFALSTLKMVEGCWQDPKEVLKAVFPNKGYDEIIHINSITFVSVCAHHFLPFMGKAHFGYLPDKNIVGLSKIPRLVEVYSKRPQIQEKLTVDIVDTFNDVVKPLGCGLVMEAYHLCVSIRGVKNESAYTKTSALRGCFKDDLTRQEFLNGISKTTDKIWP